MAEDQGEEATEKSGLKGLLSDQKAMVGAGLLVVWGGWWLWPDGSASCSGWDETLIEMVVEDYKESLSKVTTPEVMDRFTAQDFELVAVRTVSEDESVGSVVCEASVQGRKLTNFGPDGQLKNSTETITHLEYESYLDEDGAHWVRRI